MDRLYYLNNGTAQTGPFTIDAIREMRPQGITNVWYAGLENWVAVDQVPELKGLVNAAAPPLAYAPPSYAPPAGAPPVSQQVSPIYRTQAPDPLLNNRGALANEIDKLYSSMVMFYILFIVGLLVTVVLAIVFAEENEEEAAGIIAVIGGLATLVFLIMYIVSFCKLHYRNWIVTIDRTGFNDHSAGQAVGLLFIPLFNLYWAFPSYQKLAELINRALADERFEGRGPKVNVGTSTAMCVLNIVAVIPYLGALIGLVNIFIWFNVHNMNRKATTFILRSGL